LNQADPSSKKVWDMMDRGSPVWTKTEKYRSGVIVVPPGYLESNLMLHEPFIDGQGCVDLNPAPTKLIINPGVGLY